MWRFAKSPAWKLPSYLNVLYNADDLDLRAGRCQAMLHSRCRRLRLGCDATVSCILDSKRYCAADKACMAHLAYRSLRPSAWFFPMSRLKQLARFEEDDKPGETYLFMAALLSSMASASLPSFFARLMSPRPLSDMTTLPPPHV